MVQIWVLEILLEILFSSVKPPAGSLKIFGQKTLVDGENVTLTCVAGPSFPGRQLNILIYITFYLIILNFILLATRLKWLDTADNVLSNKYTKSKFIPKRFEDSREMTKLSLNITVSQILLGNYAK